MPVRKCVRAHTGSRPVTEDNAGDVLIPGYRVFIAVRPSVSGLWVKCPMVPSCLRGIKSHRTASAAPLTGTEVTATRWWLLTYVVRLSRGLAHFAAEQAPRDIYLPLQDPRIYNTKGPAGRLSRSSKNNSTYLR